MSRQSNQNERFVPFKLKSLDDLVVGCKLLTNSSISIIYDKKTCQFTENEIKKAIQIEVVPCLKQIITEINKKGK
jgi:hypothetical protein